VGDLDGGDVGKDVGSGVGRPGKYVGVEVGDAVGNGVGLPKTYVGFNVGVTVGRNEGLAVGSGVDFPGR